MVYASMFGALTAIGAFIVIIHCSRFPSVCNHFFAVWRGCCWGVIPSVLSQIVYLLLGIMGTAGFCRGQSGLGTSVWSTGGYLLGFVVAAC
jgi:biotin transport system substrate-specific component